MKMLREKPVLWFFVLTYALSWGAFGWGFVVVGEVGSISDLVNIPSRVTTKALMPYIVAASFGPFAAALFMMAMGPNPREDVLRWLKGFIRFKVHPIVYILTLFVLPTSYFLILTVLGTPGITCLCDTACYAFCQRNSDGIYGGRTYRRGARVARLRSSETPETLRRHTGKPVARGILGAVALAYHAWGS
jgi:hypothetical protein